MKVNGIESQNNYQHYFYWFPAQEVDSRGHRTQQAIMKVPNSICSRVSGGCESGNYAQLISALSGSQIVRDLKQAWKADVVMLVTRNGDRDGSAGKAMRLTRPGDMSQANSAVSVVKLDSEPGIFLHEILHNLGAGHSKYNSKPGDAPARAKMGYFSHYGRTLSHGFTTFMGYPSVCSQKLIPGAGCSNKCYRRNFLSQANKRLKIGDTEVMIGSPQDNNWGKVMGMIWTINNFSTFYKPSVPEIQYITNAPEPNLKQEFSSQGSTVNSGDLLEWSVILPNGQTAHRTSYGNVNYLFRFTPVVVGNYVVKLQIGDEVKTFPLQVKIEELKAPDFSMGADSSKVMWNVRWDKVDGADFYEARVDGTLSAKINQPYWGEVRHRIGTQGQLFSLRACDNSGKCGNAKTSKIPKMCSYPICIQ